MPMDPQVKLVLEHALGQVAQLEKRVEKAEVNVEVEAAREREKLKAACDQERARFDECIVEANKTVAQLSSDAKQEKAAFLPRIAKELRFRPRTRWMAFDQLM